MALFGVSAFLAFVEGFRGFRVLKGFSARARLNQRASPHLYRCVCMHAGMYVRMYVCMSLCAYVTMYACICTSMCTCFLDIGMYACMHVCM